MQNRFCLHGIPKYVREDPEVEEVFKNLIEDCSCFLDHFEWLDALDTDLNVPITLITPGFTDKKRKRDEVCYSACMELNLENFRTRIINYFNENEVVLKEFNIRFHVRAAIATSDEIASMLIKCNLDNHTTVVKENKFQTIYYYHGCIPDKTISITLNHTIGTGGGTGSETWRGGALLAEQLCLWLGNGIDSKCNESELHMNMKCLFENMDIMELGAGSAGLPSLALASIVAHGGSGTNSMKVRSICATDGIDECVGALSENVVRNGLSDYMQVRLLDWSEHTSNTHKEPNTPVSNSGSNSTGPGPGTGTACIDFDCLLFADCIYDEYGATLLSNCIDVLLRPTGCVIGILPPFRVGVKEFEKRMVEIGFIPEFIEFSKPPIASESVLDTSSETKTQTQYGLKQQGFHTVGVSGAYRMCRWTREVKLDPH